MMGALLRPLAGSAQSPTVLFGRLTILLALTAPALALALGHAGAAVDRGTAPSLARMPAGQNGAVNASNVAPAPPPNPAALALRASNQAIPLVASGLSAVRPFMIAAPFEDIERAVDCLAAAQYYEAGRGGEDQRAVAQVVLNRVRHPTYPATICGVVFQGAQLNTGCQFTFTCDGSLQRRWPSAQAWVEAQQTARQMLFGRTEPAVGQATHYHTEWVSPPWSRQMDKIASVRTHLFFRWRGSPGELSALKQAYAETEPQIGALATLSPAHRGDSGADQVTVAAPAMAPASEAESLAAARSPSSLVASIPLSAAREILPDRIQAASPGVFLVALPAGAAPDSFVQMAEQACTGQTPCRFIGWTDPARRAGGLPMSGSSVDAISFTFVRRETAVAGNAQWNCAEFRQIDAGRCLQRRS